MKGRKKRVIIFLVLGTIISLGVVVFLRHKVKSYEVYFDLQVDQFSFRTAESWKIYTPSSKEVTLQHLDDITLSFLAGKTSHEHVENLNIKHKIEDWYITVESDALMEVILDDISPQAKIFIEKNDGLSIRLNNAKVQGRIHSGEWVILKCAYCQLGQSGDNGTVSTQEMETTGMRMRLFDEIRFNESTRTLLLQLFSPSINSDSTLGRGVRIDEILFKKSLGNLLKTTIISGEVTFDKLDKKIILQRNDFLEISGLRDFYIDEITIGNNIHLLMHGNVMNLACGKRGNVYDRLPTKFEELKTSPTLIIVGGILSILGLLGGLSQIASLLFGKNN